MFATQQLCGRNHSFKFVVTRELRLNGEFQFLSVVLLGIFFPKNY